MSFSVKAIGKQRALTGCDKTRGAQIVKLISQTIVDRKLVDFYIKFPATLVSNYQTTRCHVPEDYNLDTCKENPKYLRSSEESRHSDGLGAGELWFGSRQGARFFSIASRPGLGPTQPPIQWVPGSVSPG
jgi:hypothetical protein